MTTAYYVSSDSGINDRFILETVPNGKLLKATLHQANYDWSLGAKVQIASIPVGKKSGEEAEVLYHSKVRRGLRKKYKNQLTIYSTLTTKL
jgi:hypothetical protein